MNSNNLEIAKQDEYLKANISNMVSAAKYKNQVKFTGFLDERQQLIAQQQLSKLRYGNFIFYGGTDNCDRNVLGIFPEDIEASFDMFPIDKIQLSFSNRNEISHRDCLGSLMGLQLERTCIGDILIDTDKVLFFVMNTISDFILVNLNKVGKVNVTPSLSESCNIEKIDKYEEINGTVASLRLDCIVALLLAKSRTISVETIVSGRVKVNYFDVDNISYIVKPNDVITIRGKGKYIIGDDLKLTKKSRYFIEVKKLI
ncbi:YlmH/Sll1252 family protein [Paludicola sp. MB14-C6]|uniref:YlmH family RNA-binding protein n=1 Tax=Paludihabitans sp. MB14-C6 TaxID=3070656 RepID=UPI0027DB43C6|nr:YlmH/Sll1252 family protein [Paludicola sp. MB14-C6]WMJ23112.1 YlmH/Sll1252 family protein [Paludicola sp. MB14-C6]